MAKKDLDLILNKIRNQINASNDLRNELDTYSHEFSASSVQVYKEVLYQLKDLISTLDSPSPTEINRRESELSTLAEAYVEYLYRSFKQYKGSATIVFRQGSSAKSFTINVSDKTKRDSKVSVFGVINSIRTRQKGLPELRKNILERVFNSNKEPQLDRALFGTFRKDEASGREIRSGGLLQLGHDKSGSVSLRRKAQLLKSFSYRSNIDKLLMGTSIDKTVRAEIAIAVNTYAKASAGSLLKDFTTTVVLNEESAFRNQGDAASEKATLRKLTQEVSKVLRKDIDFFRQRGSMSAMEVVTLRLLDTAKKSGAKVSKYKTAGQGTTKSNTLKIESSNRSGKTKESIALNVPKAQREAPVDRSPNWLQLIPLINAKLTPQVMKNMSSPRLVNRTGRFAQSARVVNVEQTSQGFPSFVFDYERDPYDVFDRTLGRAPWNTPQRDPRALVDQSVREIVREMAIGRFFTRRA